MRDLFLLAWSNPLFPVLTLAFGLCLMLFRPPLPPLFRSLMVVAGALVLSLVAPLAAFAQAVAVTTAQPDTLFHIPPLVWTEINELLIGLFLAVGAMVWKWIDAHSPLKKTQAEEVARTAFQNILLVGAKYGVSQLQAQEKKVGDIDVGNPAIAAGANFVISHAPDMAKKLGFDVTTPEGQAAIIRSVTARIADLLPAGDALGATAPATITLPAELQPTTAPAGLPAAPPAPTPAPASPSV